MYRSHYAWQISVLNVSYNNLSQHNDGNSVVIECITNAYIRND